MNLPNSEFGVHDLSNLKLRPCPHCFIPVEKNGGCDHMHCSSCDKSFNWVTGKKTVEEVTYDGLNRSDKEKGIPPKSRQYLIPGEIHPVTNLECLEYTQLEDPSE